jgi:hypothetical protein
MQKNQGSMREKRGSMQKNPAPKREHGNGRARDSSPLRVVSAVLGAFIGIRKSSARDRDLASLRPVHVIVAAIVAAALFVIIIVTLVNLIA